MNSDERRRHAEAQDRVRRVQIAKGWVQINVWAPEAARADLKLQAEVLRKHPHLTIGPLRDPMTGRLVALRLTR